MDVKKFIYLLIAIFIGIHFYTKYTVEKNIEEEIPANTGEPSLLFADGGKKPVIVAYGDSFTAGVGAPQGSDYPSQLGKLLGFPVTNAGQSGLTSEQAVTGVNDIIQTYHPDIILLQVGADEMVRGRKQLFIIKNLIQTIENIKKAGVKPVLIGFPDPDLIDMHVSSDDDLYEKVVEKTHVYYIPDVFSDVVSEGELVGNDFIHPTAEGYAKAANNIYKYLVEHPL